MIFATPNQFQFKTTSRKDDLLSLCYLLVYLFQGGNVDFVIRDQNMSKVDIFHLVGDIKSKMTAESLVGDENSRSRPLLPFVKDIMNLEYESAPNYTNLRFLLISCLVK